MQVQSYKFRGYEPVSGVALRQGAARLLVQSSRDYELDGYQLLRNHGLTCSTGEADRQLALVLWLKKGPPLTVPPYPVESDQALFNQLRETQELIAVYIRNDTFLTGRVQQVNSASFRRRLLSTKGLWLEIHPFRFQQIKLIEIGTDYLHSLHLLSAHNEGLATRDGGR